MPVGDTANPKIIHPINGIQLGVTAAGVRYQNRHDVMVMALEPGAHTALVSTTNACAAAPVVIARAHAKNNDSRYLIVNTGNANAATGADGHKRALLVCDALAGITQVDSEQILPFSTGVIGDPLNHTAIIDGLPSCLSNLHSDNWQLAANAIRTTDTVDKIASDSVEVDGVIYHATGISKGSGMIRPNMATMLAFVGIDAHIQPALLNVMLKELVECSFNRITVDGDTSTNDCCTLVATGSCLASAATKPVIDTTDHAHYGPVMALLKRVFIRLATLIVRDGEGASKFITVQVDGGSSTQECCNVAYAVAHSPLVKTAFFASDPNWGRILAAIGYADVDGLDIAKVSVRLDEVVICSRGQRDANYTEQAGQRVMTRPEICVHIDLQRGDASDTVYTCDLSHDYVSINSDYRS